MILNFKLFFIKFLFYLIGGNIHYIGK